MNESTRDELKTRLRALLEREALKRGDFTLSSGKKSAYYLDGRVITLTPEGACLVAQLMLDMVAQGTVEAIGGPTLGADPIVGAVAVLSYQQNRALQTFIVRKAAKEHGSRRQVEGPQLRRGAPVVIVDDVATTGKALLEAHQALQSIGVQVVKALVIVDRLEGASENLARVGVALESIFTIRDFGL